MSARKHYQDQRPANGCARCVWWEENFYDNWGYCQCNRDKAWWQHGPCEEYERDPDIPDEI